MGLTQVVGHGCSNSHLQAIDSSNRGGAQFAVASTVDRLRGYADSVDRERPAYHGVVLAVHAFQPIARLYEAMTEAGETVSKSPDFQRRFAQIRKVNRDGAEVVLGHGVPTAVGRGLLDEMRRWDEHFTA
jgi:HEXXH motif-containing protein